MQARERGPLRIVSRARLLHGEESVWSSCDMALESAVGRGAGCVCSRHTGCYKLWSQQ